MTWEPSDDCLKEETDGGAERVAASASRPASGTQQIPSVSKDSLARVVHLHHFKAFLELCISYIYIFI